MHAELIAKLEALSGPDREIDAAIVASLNNAIVKRYPPTDDFGPKNRWQFWSEDGKHFLGSEGKYPVPPYTASLDATIALVERLLPGRWPDFLRGGLSILAERHFWHIEPRKPGQEHELPSAVLICLLRALSPEPPK